MHKLDEKALAAAELAGFLEYVGSGDFYTDYDASGEALGRARKALTTLAALPPEQSAAQQPATDAVVVRLLEERDLLREALCKYGDRARMAWAPPKLQPTIDEAFTALSQSPAKPAGDSLQQRPAAEEKRP